MHMKTELYCIPVNVDLSLDEILEEAVEPSPHPYYMFPGENHLKFHEFIDKYNVDPSDFKVEHSGIQSYRFANWDEGEGDRWEWFKKMVTPSYPCVTREMFHSSNPVHMARFASAVWWKIMANNAPVVDVPDPETGKLIPTKIAPNRKFVDDFYRSMKYDDLCERPPNNDPYPCGNCGCCQERYDNINSVFNNSYHIPTCRTLYESEICIGSTCPKFKMFLKDVDERKLKS
jgi:hypothetical protein